MKQDSKKTKFSVLMSIYFKEQPEYLDLCLRSILVDQTLLPDEIVMVKDGKLTKELEKVLLKYDKKYPNIFKFIPLEENVGLGKALQIGLKECSYDLVMRMDTDDVCVPNRFEKQIEYMKKNRGVAIVGGYIGEFKENIDEKLRLKQMPISHEDVVKYAKFRNPLNHMTVCFRKKDILEVGSYQPLFYLEDHYLWSRMLVAGKKIENIPEVLVYARIGNGFEQRRGNKNYIAGWKKLQKYLYDNKFINLFQRIRNLLGMYVFIYVPGDVRSFFYNKVLRKKCK